MLALSDSLQANQFVGLEVAQTVLKITAVLSDKFILL